MGRLTGCPPQLFLPSVTAIGKILLYLLIVILAGILLAPPIYWGIQALADHGLLTGLAKHPFHRYFSRITQVSALVLIVPLLFWLGIRNVREFGLEKNPSWARDLGFGLAVALIPVIVLGVSYFFFDVYKVKKELGLGHLFRILMTAGVVATVEEFLFRGVLLGLAARAFGRIPALLGVSTLFAVIHFAKPAKAVTEKVEWYSGMQQIAAIVDGLPAVHVLGFGILSLFIGGLILGTAALWTRSLWLPIGIHAGWITGQQGIQWFGKFRAKPPEEFLPWVGPNLVSGAVPTGLAPVIVLLITGGLVWLYLRHASARRVPDRA
ncbi:MAG: hypothetical protein BGO12_04785 [Verrucomicrobia bacterium 61-8]|nr:MAG: hypothetical protein BGO12_04785 [Verrucomicrobia bacterium 61-8]